MAIFNKNDFNNLPPEDRYENKPGLENLALYFTIVDFGQGDKIVKSLQKYSSVQFVSTAEGTATEYIREILSIEDSRKEVVITVLKEKDAPKIKQFLNETVFNKKNVGIGFSISLTSIIGVKMYQFLANQM